MIQYLINLLRKQTHQEFPNYIKLVFKAEDFKGNSYTDVSDCAITRAVKRQLKLDHVITGPYDVTINDKKFAIIGEFGPDKFYLFKEKLTKNPDKELHINLMKLY